MGKTKTETQSFTTLMDSKKAAEYRDKYLAMLYKDIPEWEMWRFLNRCNKLNIDPLDDAYLAVRNSKIKGVNGQPDTWEKKFSFVMYYPVWIRLAKEQNYERHNPETDDVELLPLVESLTYDIEFDDNNQAVFVWSEIKLANMTKPSRYRNSVKELIQGGYVAQKMPGHMALKTCIVRNLNFCMPEVFHGAYLPEELSLEHNEGNGTSTPIVRAPIQSEPEVKLPTQKTETKKELKKSEPKEKPKSGLTEEYEKEPKSGLVKEEKKEPFPDEQLPEPDFEKKEEVKKEQSEILLSRLVAMRNSFESVGIDLDKALKSKGQPPVSEINDDNWFAVKNEMLPLYNQYTGTLNAKIPSDIKITPKAKADVPEKEPELPPEKPKKTTKKASTKKAETQEPPPLTDEESETLNFL